MKIKLITLSVILLVSLKMNAQSPCFYNPNQGPIYSNGSSGAIYDVTTQDFNSDGHLDIVTANSVANNISFIPGYGDGTLGIPDTTFVPGTLFCITSGDYNGDGNFDIATARNFDVFILFGNGDGTFQPFQSYSGAYRPSRIYSRDLNNDGILDLIEAAGNGIFVLIGQSNGTFLPAAQYPGSSNDLTIADVDNDSILDIVFSNEITWTESEISFLKGHGDGSFSPGVSVFSMIYPDNSIAGIAAEDVNNDGSNDLIVGNSGEDRVEIYTGNNDGTFNSPVFYTGLFQAFYVYLADVNNDLITDIVAMDNNGFSILMGNSNGIFDAPQRFLAMPAPNSFAIGDYDEDGKIDVIAPSAYSGSPLIAVMLNCGITSGINESYPNPSSITIYPNPSSSEVTIQSDYHFNNATFTIYSSTGQKVNQITHNSGQYFKLLHNNLSSGMYYLVITEDNNVVATEKLVVSE